MNRLTIDQEREALYHAARRVGLVLISPIWIRKAVPIHTLKN